MVTGGQITSHNKHKRKERKKGTVVSFAILVPTRKKTAKSTNEHHQERENSRTMQTRQHLRSLWPQARTLIPTTLHHSPQLVCERQMCRSRRPLATLYCLHGLLRCAIGERSRPGEYLCDRDDSKPRVGPNNPFVTHLDHDHCERENIPFLAVHSAPSRDLWCGPLHSVIWIIRDTLCRTRALNDRSTTKIHDPCLTSDIHEDIRLEKCQCGGKTWLGTTTYSLEISINYIAGVEISKAISDTSQLVEEVSMESNTTAGKHTRPSRSASGHLTR